jgi:hypothetical protein
MSMSSLERAIIVLAVIVSLLWGAGLTIAYMFRDDNGTTASPPAAVPSVTQPPPPQAATPPPATPQPQTPQASVQAAPPGGDPGASIFSAVARPQSVPPEPTAEEKRKYIAGFWKQSQNSYSQESRARLEARTGSLLSDPHYQTEATTKPDTRPSLDPTLITLHIDKLPARAAFAAFGRTAKTKIALLPRGAWNRVTSNPISFDADNKPLLEVLNQLCCAGGITSGLAEQFNWDMPAPADPGSPLMTLQLQNDNEGMGPWAISGPFGFEVTQIDHSAPINAGPTPGGNLAVLFSVIHEPRIVLLGQSPQVKVTEAVDDRGNNLTPTITYPAGPPPLVQSTGQINAGLPCPANYGRTITRLTGSVTFLIQTSAERIEIPITGNMQPFIRNIDGVALTIDQWQTDSPQQIRCAMHLRYDGADDAHWLQLAQALGNLHPVYLDASGTPLPAAHPMSLNTYQGQANADYLCIQQFYGGSDDMLHPAKLILDFPTGFELVEVPVHFENLPLP